MLWSLRRLAEVEARLPSGLDWLSTPERERVAGLRVETRRRQYLCGHWLVRELVAERTGVAASACQLEQRRGQAPRLTQPDAGLSVSISHSGEWIAAAVADAAVGVDIELQSRTHHLQSIAGDLLAVGEAPQQADATQLLQRWVAKEAWIKCSHGAALPGRLGEIRLHAVDRDGANVCVCSSAELFLGLACLAGVAHVGSSDAAQALSWWRVEDTARVT